MSEIDKAKHERALPPHPKKLAHRAKVARRAKEAQLLADAVF